MMNFKDFYILVSEKREEAGFLSKVANIPGAINRFSDTNRIWSGLKSMADDGKTGYQPVFKKHESDKSSNIYDAKTVSEQRKLLAKWRDQNITSKDGNRQEKELKNRLVQDDSVIRIYSSAYDSDNLGKSLKMVSKERPDLISPADFKKMFVTKDGKHKLKERAHLPFMVVVSDTDATDVEGIVDGMYRSAAGQLPKIFDRPGHYANQVIDSIDVYMQRGYGIEEAKSMARKKYSPKGMDYLDSAYHIDTLR
jgi:hypothetical protein